MSAQVDKCEAPARALLASLLAGAALIAATPASAATYHFDVVVPMNSSQNVGTNLTMDVTDGGTGALFKIANSSGPSGSFIDEVYWDWGGSKLLLNPIAAFGPSQGTVAYEQPAVPANLPGGNTIGFTAKASAQATSTANAIQTGEYETFLLTYGAGATQGLTSVLNYLDSGGLKVGLHVKNLPGGGQSDAYVNCKGEDCGGGGTAAVPLPAAAWLFGSALVGFVSLSNRRKMS